jgi:hypothetical protein
MRKNELGMGAPSKMGKRQWEDTGRKKTHCLWRGENRDKRGDWPLHHAFLYFPPLCFRALFPLNISENVSIFSINMPFNFYLCVLTHLVQTSIVKFASWLSMSLAHSGDHWVIVGQEWRNETVQKTRWLDVVNTNTRGGI